MVTSNNDIPAPSNFEAIDAGSDYIDLKWDKANSELPIVYKIIMRKENTEWVKCYEGTETKYRCTDLELETQYIFSICSSYNGKISPGYAYCSKKTDKSLLKKAATTAAVVGVGAVTAAIALVTGVGVAGVAIGATGLAAGVIEGAATAGVIAAETAATATVVTAGAGALTAGTALCAGTVNGVKNGIAEGVKTANEFSPDETSPLEVLFDDLPDFRNI